MSIDGVLILGLASSAAWWWIAGALVIGAVVVVGAIVARRVIRSGEEGEERAQPYRTAGSWGWLSTCGWVAAFPLLLVGIWLAMEWGMTLGRETFDVLPDLDRAQRMAESGDHRGAETLYSSAIALDPSHSEAFVGRARCRMRLRDFRGVIEDLASAEGVGAESVKLTILRARAWIALGEYQRALPDLALALARPEDKTEALLLRGAVLKDLGDLEGATRDLNELIRDNPLQPLAYLMRAEAHLMGTRFQEALADYDRVPKVLRDTAGCLFGRGLARLGIGRAEEALADLEKARRAGVDSRAVHEAKALALEVLGRHNEAEEARVLAGGARLLPARTEAGMVPLGPEEVFVLLKNSRADRQAAPGGVSRTDRDGAYPVR